MFGCTLWNHKPKSAVEMVWFKVGKVFCKGPDFADPRDPVTTSQLCHCPLKAAIDSTQVGLCSSKTGQIRWWARSLFMAIGC